MMRAFILFIAFLVVGTRIENAHAIQQFIVHFQEGERDRLDPKQWFVGLAGEAVIAEAAAVYRKYGGFILLIGHDQSVGSARNALVRSRFRAESVRDVLVRFGVPATSITTKACGFTNPMVENPEGASEPQNRYVTFDFLDERSDLVKATSSVCPRAARDAAN